MNVLDIEFRGKRVDDGKWVYGDLTRYNKHKSYITVDLIENEVYEVHTNTVGMYTGLNDANGKKVYNGDVFAGGMEIIWDEKRWCFSVRWLQEYNLGKKSEYLTQPLYVTIYNSDFKLPKVIGNVYDGVEE